MEKKTTILCTLRVQKAQKSLKRDFGACFEQFLPTLAIFRNFRDFWRMLVDLLHKRFSRKGRGGTFLVEREALF
jgi:hypothetical protein